MDVIVKTICPSDFLQNGFVETRAFEQWAHDVGFDIAGASEPKSVT